MNRRKSCAGATNAKLTGWDGSKGSLPMMLTYHPAATKAPIAVPVAGHFHCYHSEVRGAANK